MKQTISIAIDDETLELIEEALKNKKFRNRSHAIEFIINEKLREEKNGN